MTTFLCVMILANFALLVGYFLRKEFWYRQQEAIVGQMWELLRLIKDYRESARVQHREADLAKADVTATVEAKSQELATKIEEVPVKVVEVLKNDPDSGRHRAARPLRTDPD